MQKEVSKAYDQLNKACNEFLKEVKKEFKWKIRYNKYQIFKDILNEND